MKVRCCAARAVAIAVVMAPHAFAQQSTQKTIPADIAMTLVREAVLKCRADGFKATAKVADASNVQLAMYRDEGATARSLELAQLKINTVLLTGRPSGRAPGAAPQEPSPGVPQRQLRWAVWAFDAAGAIVFGINAEGGVPIMMGNDLVGALAVSGAPTGPGDAACANAALAKVADKLK